MKKIIALLLAALMVLSIAACAPAGNDDATDGSQADTSAADGTSGAADDTAASGEKYVIGICQLTPHVALDAATDGFIQVCINILRFAIGNNYQLYALDFVPIQEIASLISALFASRSGTSTAMPRIVASL